ncbi:hypothetical protein FSP39_000592 [Pinctada imbricata]|uniref:Calcium uniporter protein n=1 Tax=Pinctada imbricata TaxID=66713 RepID=A0AA88XRC4_PINIB|nr:hypothetical protein FSP39_000592 [Pinctada imbricata]
MASSRLLFVVRQELLQQLHPFRGKESFNRHKISRVFCQCSYYNTGLSNGKNTKMNFRYIPEAAVTIRDGLPVFTVPLPSRHEKCEFTLKPISNTVGDFLQYMEEEDGGIDRAVIYTAEGVRIAKSTTIDVLLKTDFKLVINNTEYDIAVPKGIGSFDSEEVKDVSEVKSLIGKLYSTLNVEEYQIQEEKKLLAQLEELQLQIAPMEKMKHELDLKAKKRTTFLAWTGLGLMGLQFGFLARLTWWEYSWDIMEPVTYFVTYGTTMAMFAYFVLTKQEYNFVEVKDRQHLLSLHGNAKKNNFDIQKYNDLREAITKLEYDIQRLRDPLQLRVPIRELEALKKEGA